MFPASGNQGVVYLWDATVAAGRGIPVGAAGGSWCTPLRNVRLTDWYITGAHAADAVVVPPASGGG